MATQELKFQFKVSEEGEIKIINRKEFEREMVQNFKGKTVIGTFKKPRKMRSNQQNSYYWSCVVPEVLDGLIEAGFEPNELNKEVVHDMLRHKFLKVDLPSPEFTGEFITVTKSTTELGVGEFLDYIAEIQRWSATFLGHIIPDPNSQKEINFL